MDLEGADGVVAVLAHPGDVAGEEDAARERVHSVGVVPVVCAVEDQVELDKIVPGTK